MQQQHRHPQVLLDFGERFLVAFLVHVVGMRRRQVGQVRECLLAFRGQLLSAHRQSEPAEEGPAPGEQLAGAGHGATAVGQQQPEAEIGIRQLGGRGDAQRMQRTAFVRSRHAGIRQHVGQPCRSLGATRREPTRQRAMQFGGAAGQPVALGVGRHLGPGGQFGGCHGAAPHRWKAEV